MLTLDFSTMVFMAMVLTFCLTLLLLYLRAHADGIEGPGHWALANFSLCSGMLTVLFNLGAGMWWILPSIALLTLGNGFCINGIRGFKGLPVDRRLPFLLAGVAAIVNAFLLDQHAIRLLVLFNSTFLALEHLVCAWLLYHYPQDGKAKSACQPTALLFGILVLSMVYRFYSAAIAKPEVFTHLADWQVNKVNFLIGSVAQLFVTFGFTQMISFRKSEELQRIANFDGLTNILNRRGLENEAKRIRFHCKRSQQPLAMLLLDLDHFKKVNDRYGHPFGDEVLRQFTRLVKKEIRPSDIFARFGGEEFCILMPGASEMEAYHLAERIRSAFADKVIILKKQNAICTVSIGVSDSTRAGYDLKGMLASADAALYAAKAGGRNRVVGHSSISGYTESENALQPAAG